MRRQRANREAWARSKAGAALFATFFGFLANAFLSSRKDAAPPDGRDLHTSVRNLERLLAEQQRATAALREQLAALDAP